MAEFKKLKQTTTCSRGIAEKMKRPISGQSSGEALNRNIDDRHNMRKKRRKQLRPTRMMVIDELPEEDEMETCSLNNIKHDYQSSNNKNGINIREKEINPSVPLDLSVNQINHCSKDKVTPTVIHEMISEVSDISPVVRRERKEKYKKDNTKIPLNKHFHENTETSKAELIMRQILRNALATGDGNKIFNFDAFCNICNKEFCNKYFLRTHRANKHGVYSENNPENVNILSSITNMFNRKHIKLERSNSQSTTSSCGNKDLSAFCNFCEKEFCNKYFLKKHKEKMHGIIAEKDTKKKDKGFNDNSNTSGEDCCDKDTKTQIVSIVSKSIAESENKIPINKTEQSSRPGVIVQLGESSTAPAQSKQYTRHTVSEMLKFCIKNVDQLPENKNNTQVIIKNTAPMNSKTVQSSISPTDITNALEVQSRFPDINTINEVNGINDNIILQDSQNLGNTSEESILNEIANYPENLFVISQYDEQKVNGVSNGLEAQEFSLNNSNVVNGNYSYNNNPSLAVNKENHKLKQMKQSPATIEQTADSIMPSVHRDTKQNNCIVCNKFFSGYLFARLHEKYVHMIMFKERNQECGSTMDYSTARFNFLMQRDELQRLQHLEKVYFMIIKFSCLNTFVTFCEICKRDYEKSDILEMHLINNHSEILDEISGIIDDVNSSVLNLKDGLIICNNCNMVFATVTTLQHHLYENCSSYLDTSATTPVKDDGKSPNFCNFCKKELCNKYFMRTHMQRMHGISMENNTRMGGVTCEICNKELCSKYFLRVHKRNCHGILEGIEINKSYPQLSLGQSISIKDVENALFEDNTLKFLPQTCLICRKIFKNVKWLKTHLVNEHKEIGLNVWNEILTTYVIQGGTNLSEKVSSTNNSYASIGSGDSSGSLQRNVSTNTEPISSPTVLGNRKDLQVKGHKGYQCQHCSFFTTVAETLITHEEIHRKHNISVQENVDFCCLYCLHVARDRISLENHTKAYHFTNDGVENSIRLDQYEGLAAKTVAAILSGEIAISTLSPEDTEVGDPVNNIENASGYNYVMPLPSYRYKSDQFVKDTQTCTDNNKASGLINMRKKSNSYNIRK